MNVRELIAFLQDCDPEAVVLPGQGKMSGWTSPVKSARISQAMEKTTVNAFAPAKTKYLEMPVPGPGKVTTVVLDT